MRSLVAITLLLALAAAFGCDPSTSVSRLGVFAFARNGLLTECCNCLASREVYVDYPLHVCPEVDVWLPEDERAPLREARNAVTALGQAQSRHLARLFSAGTAEHVLLARLDQTLADLTDVQGGLERIKRSMTISSR